MLEVFRVPPNLASELLAFLNHQDCYELLQLEQLQLGLEPLTIQVNQLCQEMSQKLGC